MRSYIIGIAGELNSGKDTLASMINYIFHVGITKAKYEEWLIHRIKWNKTNEDRITHFADPLKDCLSIMYNIPRWCFEDRIKKDEEYYDLTNKVFVKYDPTLVLKYAIITNNYIENEEYYLDIVINKIIKAKRLPIIKLRTLMQYFGTEIVRNQMGQNIWINSTMSRTATIAERRTICIIPDVRFTNEIDAIRGNSLYGGDILIRRDNTDKTKHASETIDFACKYTIENNGTKMQLFYKAINVVNVIIKI